jgi:RimJ/RimL family protein N-acetyltransferase
MQALRLTTERLILEPLQRHDLDAFVSYRRASDVARFQSWGPDYSVVDARALLDAQPHAGFPEHPGEWIQIALRLRDPQRLVALAGDVAIGRDSVQPDTFELGVTVAPPHQGQGFARESLRAVINELFIARGAHRVVMQCDSRNGAVLRVIAALGLRPEGAALEGDWFKEEWTTLERFALLRREWNGS